MSEGDRGREREVISEQKVVDEGGGAPCLDSGIDPQARWLKASRATPSLVMLQTTPTANKLNALSSFAANMPTNPSSNS